ncbi:glutamate synthase large subunit [Heyndrickxia oleronia]|uniref:glutamate synthase large subunit n=1 Tax=Heyndrickxia oleronia TaxID=38875 RepID=UPI00242E58A3|nr:glutamate synthase large subunit [Heyndrickxia oleronia]MCI1591671.1 glutamate synthase large subunit [Heyndrickxia oleronia]MCI1614900.1 glutamate synthase large subunit [Heyndrickxia oleronia]MCI1745782.1 glutamate synthase large subunit [Heyndrickxia oleronia]
MMRQNEKHHGGLYRQDFEHDSCGIGFYADIQGRPSHDIVSSALLMLQRLDHRAGKSSDNLTSDGAGILLQIPDQFFKEVCPFTLPQKGEYAVGMLFLPTNKMIQEQIIEAFKHEASTFNLSFIGEREVPVSPEILGEVAKSTQPVIKQLFIKKANAMNEKEFLYQLYLLRRTMEKKFADQLYFSSLSNQTIVYKGLLSAEQLTTFYQDLTNPAFTSALALVHSRFSTNTFPSWERAHPNRMIAHNGEINTIKGNKNWFNAKMTGHPDVAPIIQENGSDSAMFDNALEFLLLNGWSLPQAIMVMVPEPWEQDDKMPAELKAFYEYHSLLMEPWDGPMALGFSDGKQIGAILDRNGLRPGRYYITGDDRIIFASEVGVIDIEADNIKEKRHLKPGELLFIDTEKGKLLDSDELKTFISKEKPYQRYINQQVISLKNKGNKLPASSQFEPSEAIFLQKMFGYTYEEVMKMLLPMSNDAKEPTGSMGIDTPLAVLSERPMLLFHYFKQSFSQVTNPPIDALREECVISTVTWLGPQIDLLDQNVSDEKHLKLEHPFIDPASFIALKHSPLQSKEILMNFTKSSGFEESLNRICTEALSTINEGCKLIILTDRPSNQDQVPLPSLLATSCLHHYLISKGVRTKASIIIDSGEPRDPHHMAALIGYGADAIHPYLAYETIKQLVSDRHIQLPLKQAWQNYIQALKNGVIKIMSKVGISSIQSYRGAQTFEALGISEEIISKYFSGTVSSISGIGLTEISQETMKRHANAVFEMTSHDHTLDSGSELQWRSEGEHHQFNPLSIHTLQRAARMNDKNTYKKFVAMHEKSPFTTIRSLLEIKSDRGRIPIEEVEPIEAIFKRFKTGAMSYGSLSKEAHEALAIAMNRIGGKSNSGEGGEELERSFIEQNGDFKRSAIKQVASGRFGVTSYYLTQAEEIQIKMAQGAKPGEGGQLPGSKVYPWIAEVRGSTPGVGLISPPPHHDIYSIEDLAQLIYDLKSANPHAKISVKLVAKAGVGTIAAGVAKGLADTILISGHDGGTGASPKTSIKHAGIPWEIGLAETHQTLLLNGLRDRVTLETDGKLMTGKDVVIAACLGAEEYGFATAPLVVLGCLMMRACHLDTCPVGIATQNPKLREKFMGNPDHIVNYLTFIAEEIREILAECGYRSLTEIVGQTQLLQPKPEVQEHWKAKHINLDKLLHQNQQDAHTCTTAQNHELEKRMDQHTLLPLLQPYIEKQQPVHFQFDIKNTDRAVGTLLGHYVTKLWGNSGLPPHTLQLSFNGSAGQSFGAFIPKGVSLTLEGDANDYVGKGLSGGSIVIKPTSTWKAAGDQAIIGNTAFFGATSGEAYINGTAGQRFCVRNSGVHAVVEGVGDHGCEYMTGGKVVILGSIGKNFGAGMSGGSAYIFSESQSAVMKHMNFEMINIESIQSNEEFIELYRMIQKHYQLTGSQKAKILLKQWDRLRHQFIKVIPNEYKKMIDLIHHLKQQGMPDNEASLTAFNLKKDGKTITADHPTMGVSL